MLRLEFRVLVMPGIYFVSRFIPRAPPPAKIEPRASNMRRKFSATDFHTHPCVFI